MRIRVTATVASGAIVVSALALPAAAQAAERPGARARVKGQRLCRREELDEAALLF